MVRVCCVAGCAGDDEESEDIRFFRFPRARAQEARWRAALGVEARPHRNTLVCSRHFGRQEYRGGRLAPGAVPSRGLSDSGGKDAPPRVTKDEHSLTDVRETEEDTRCSKRESRAAAAARCLRQATRARRAAAVRETADSTQDDDPGELGADCTVSRNSIEEHADKDTNNETTRSNSRIEDNSRTSTLNGFVDKSVTVEEEEPKDATSHPIPPTDPLPSPKDPCEQTNRLTDSIDQNSDTQKRPPTPPTNQMPFEKGTPDSNVTAKAVDQSEGRCDGQSEALVSLDQSQPAEGARDPLERETEPAISLDGDIDSRHTGSPDCLMLVESLQVELDPDAVYTQRDDEEQDTDDEDLQVVESKPEEVSLLTSSDESDVVLQEPLIDTVEVSDATDEDDVPLNRLCADKPRVKGVFWGSSCEFYCYVCGFVTSSKATLKEHKRSHEAATDSGVREKTILICAICGFQSSSQSQYARHMRKHKSEKKYRCGVCNYKAKHRMSLVYHMKVHKDDRSVLRCKQCEFTTKSRFDMQDHLTDDHGLVVFFCDLCPYSTKRKSDLTRHLKAKHR